MDRCLPLLTGIVMSFSVLSGGACGRPRRQSDQPDPVARGAVLSWPRSWQEGQRRTGSSTPGAAGWRMMAAYDAPSAEGQSGG